LDLLPLQKLRSFKVTTNTHLELGCVGALKKLERLTEVELYAEDFSEWSDLSYCLQRRDEWVPMPFPSLRRIKLRRVRSTEEEKEGEEEGGQGQCQIEDSELEELMTMCQLRQIQLDIDLNNLISP
jgi:hypothetical protein